MEQGNIYHIHRELVKALDETLARMAEIFPPQDRGEIIDFEVYLDIANDLTERIANMEERFYANGCN